MDITTRLEAIRDRVAAACRRARREPDSVRLVAVSKTRPAEAIDAVLSAGVSDVGENKIQEAEDKKPLVVHDATWHFVGHLQKNKAKKAVELFDVIHTLDGASLGQRLDRIAGERGKRQRVLVQVDLAGEATKFGLPEEELDDTLKALGDCRHLAVEGLMALPPFAPDPENVRPYFRRLRELSERARSAGLVEGATLSMGMSHDFEVAIEEGATLIRVGTALFGPRAAPARDTADVTRAE